LFNAYCIDVGLFIYDFYRGKPMKHRVILLLGIAGLFSFASFSGLNASPKHTATAISDSAGKHPLSTQALADRLTTARVPFIQNE
jgi:hypothetical protein